MLETNPREDCFKNSLSLLDLVFQSFLFHFHFSISITSKKNSLAHPEKSEWHFSSLFTSRLSKTHSRRTLLSGLLVSTFLVFTGFSGFLVYWFTGLLVSLVSLVYWFLWFTVFSGLLVSLVFWFIGFYYISFASFVLLFEKLLV